jgi:hypothetical protein
MSNDISEQDQIKLEELATNYRELMNEELQLIVAISNVREKISSNREEFNNMINWYKYK